MVRCNIWIVCLVSGLLDCSWNEIIYTVTHEMAHVFFEHYIGDESGEIEADKQVVKWGFEKELKHLVEFT